MAKKKETKKVEEPKEIKFYTEELKKSKTINEDTIKIITFLIILVIVLGLFFGLFYLNGKFVTKDKYQDNNTTTTTEAIYDETKVTVSTMYNLSNDTYYVLAYENIKLYTLDLTNAMNKKYYNKDKAENITTNNKADINFTKHTLLVFKNGKIIEAITNKDDITTKLSNK